MKIGDRVRYIDLGSYDHGKECTIVNIILTLLGYRYHVQFDAMPLFITTKENLEEIPTASTKFQPGDQVKVNHHFDSSWPLGHIFTVTGIYQDGTLAGMTAMGWPGAIAPKFVDIVPKPCPPPISTHNIIFSNQGILLQRGGLNELVNESVTPYNKVGDAMSNTCTHKWQTYIGLNKKMEICTLCPATKNERGIYD